MTGGEVRQPIVSTPRQERDAWVAHLVAQTDQSDPRTAKRVPAQGTTNPTPSTGSTNLRPR